MKMGRYRWPPSNSRRSTIGWFDGTSTRTPTCVTRITAPPPRLDPTPGFPAFRRWYPAARDSLAQVSRGGFAQEHGPQRPAEPGEVHEVDAGLRAGVGILALEPRCDDLIEQSGLPVDELA